MKQTFKLLKYYPSCYMKVGQIITFQDGEDETVLSQQGRDTYVIELKDCQNNPEFWEEVKEYNFKVGTWYKNLGRDRGFISKFTKLEAGEWVLNGEYICNKEYIKDSTKYLTTYIGNAIECTLEEILDYLPDNHPDKIQKFKVGEWIYFYNSNTSEGIVRYKSDRGDTDEYYHICGSSESIIEGKSNGCYISIKECTKATNEQIKRILTKVAIYKGFKKGIYIDNTNLGFYVKNKSCGSNFSLDEYYLLLGDWIIYKDGVWATIVEQPKSKVLKFGELDVTIEGTIAKTKYGDITLEKVLEIDNWINTKINVLDYECIINAKDIQFGCQKGTKEEFDAIRDALRANFPKYWHISTKHKEVREYYAKQSSNCYLRETDYKYFTSHNCINKPIWGNKAACSFWNNNPHKDSIEITLEQFKEHFL